VDPFDVVVGDVVREKPPEVALAENDHVIEELAPTGSHSSLGERVLPETAIRRAYAFNTQVPDRGCDVSREDRVAVVDEKGKGGVRGEGLAYYAKTQPTLTPPSDRTCPSRKLARALVMRLTARSDGEDRRPPRMATTWPSSGC
jgi:hypothetical protein